MPIKFILIFLVYINSIEYSYGGSPKKYFLVEGCNIFSLHGPPLLSLPGKFCQFFDDGSFISGTTHALRRFDQKQNLLWEKKMHIHHQVNLTSDKKNILVLSSELKNIEGKLIRVDVLHRMNLNGEVLNTTNSENIFRMAKKPFKFRHMQSILKEELEGKSELELGHFNSFYEIPEIKPGASVPSFIKKGNLIASSTAFGIVILSPNLKEILHHLSVPSSKQNSIHDAQVLDNGNILIFNNNELSFNMKAPNSAIQELNPKTGEVGFSFSATPKSMFFSEYCGGVQKLSDDQIFFSHINNGVFVYSISKKDIIYSSLHLHRRDGVLVSFQQARAMELTDFLKHWGISSKLTLNL